MNLKLIALSMVALAALTILISFHPEWLRALPL